VTLFLGKILTYCCPAVFPPCEKHMLISSASAEIRTSPYSASDVTYWAWFNFNGFINKTFKGERPVR